MNRALFILLIAVTLQASAIPQLINYQGELTRPDGTPLDTTVAMTFRMYGVVSGGAAMWTESYPAVTVENGMFDVSLGSIVQLQDIFGPNNDIWLGLTVGNNTEMAPRQHVTSVAHAYRVGTVDGAGGGHILGAASVGDGTNLLIEEYTFAVGSSHTVSGGAASVTGGYINTASGTAAHVGGGVWNKARGDFSVVSGGGSFVESDSNSAQGEASVIGGGRVNHIDVNGGSATISGGEWNTASGLAAVVGGGSNNIASGGRSTVSGGIFNTASNFFSTVGGGAVNTASGGRSTVAGGWENHAVNSFSSVGGGNANVAGGEYSVVGGGGSNFARGIGSVVAGGGTSFIADSNSARGDFSVISGGLINSTSASFSVVSGGRGNSAGGQTSSVAGGAENMASGESSAVLGGQGNTASGLYSVVLGGYNNTATGTSCCALGSYAHAVHSGALVWCDDSGLSLTSSTINQFSARASGGYRFFTTTGAVGAQLTAGSTAWSALSDSTVKVGRQRADTKDVLNKLTAMNIDTWRYKHQPDGPLHMGPMAQDMYNAFGLGDDETMISTIDADGVLFAAVQQLAKQNDQLQTTNDKQQKEIEELRAMVQSLQAEMKQSNLK